MKNLRNYVKFLVEAAVSGEQASKQGLALHKTKHGDYYHYVLYDPNAMASEFEDEPRFRNMRFDRNLDQLILGYIKSDQHQGDCNDAMEIKFSVASKGYGPLMYDIVMSDGKNGLMSDRVATSEKAKNVWRYYKSQRKDVKRTPFDDYDNPKTEDPCDDCLIVKDNEDLLNYSYESGSKPAAKSSLMNTHENVVKQFEEKGLDRQTFEKMLETMAEDLFNEKYD